MKSQRAQQLLNEIDLAITNIDSFGVATNSLEESYLAKFLDVFICGMYEEIIETILNEKIAMTGMAEASRFISGSLNHHFRNPDMKKIITWLAQFNTSWRTIIQRLPLQNRDALDSIVTNKNNLAHGNASTITLIQVKDYYRDSRVVIEKIDDIVL